MSDHLLHSRKHPRNIIIEPMFTEKTGSLLSSQNSYCFKVARDANKNEIKHAIESIFSVDVGSVNTMNFKGKNKRMGRYTGKRPSWKKAIVTLKKGDTIPGFDL